MVHIHRGTCCVDEVAYAAKGLTRRPGCHSWCYCKRWQPRQDLLIPMTRHPPVVISGSSRRHCLRPDVHEQASTEQGRADLTPCHLCSHPSAPTIRSGRVYKRDIPRACVSGCLFLASCCGAPGQRRVGVINRAAGSVSHKQH